MRILIDIGHPAAVHFFSQFTKEMIDKGHSILFTTRDKDVSIDLLDYYGFKYISFGKTPKKLILKILSLFSFSAKMFMVSLKFKPDIFLSRGALYILFSSFILRKPIISNLNTDVSKLNNFLNQFPDCIITPNSFRHNFKFNKHIRYNGNCELALLHPSRFVPDREILSLYDILDTEKLILVRFVSFSAFDDIGKEGISTDNRVEFISELKKYGNVIISSEEILTGELNKYHLEQNNYYKIGHLQNLEYFADIFLGDSGAMTAECAVLGTPSIYISNKDLGFINELVNKYNLAFTFLNFQDGLEKAVELLKRSKLKEEWEVKKRCFIKESIDFTSFFIWFVENYPESKIKMLANPSIQEEFK